MSPRSRRLSAFDVARPVRRRSSRLNGGCCRRALRPEFLYADVQSFRTRTKSFVSDTMSEIQVNSPIDGILPFLQSVSVVIFFSFFLHTSRRDDHCRLSIFPHSFFSSVRRSTSYRNDVPFFPFVHRPLSFSARGRAIKCVNANALDGTCVRPDRLHARLKIYESSLAIRSKRYLLDAK